MPHTQTPQHAFNCFSALSGFDPLLNNPGLIAGTHTSRPAGQPARRAAQTEPGGAGARAGGGGG